MFKHITPGDLFVVRSSEKYVSMWCSDGSTLRIKNDEHLIFITTESVDWTLAARLLFLTQNGCIVWLYAFGMRELKSRGIRRAR